MRISLDFDGVLCLTPFGRLAVHALRPVADLPDDYESLYRAPAGRRPLRRIIEELRFAWRAAAPDAAVMLRELSRDHELIIVTGRSVVGRPIVERWLRRHDLDPCITDIHMAPAGLRPPQHKLAVAKMHAVDAHIDDDPRTAYHLAKHGVRTYLLDHAGAHGHLPLPDGCSLVRSLAEFAQAIRA